MTNQDIIKIIQQEGIGKYLREINEYSSYIQFFLTSDSQYEVDLFLNPHLAHFNKCLYKGDDKNKAGEIFNEAIEKDRKIKENWMYKLFDKKIFYN